MKRVYKESISTCHQCGMDIKGIFWESSKGIQLETTCPVHGKELEWVEKDISFFQRGYEYEHYIPRLKHLILPITYRCNLACKYCFAHSNYKHSLPEDRSINKLLAIVESADCSIVNLSGGEPTVRKDLPELLQAFKQGALVKRLSIITNGQRTSNEKYLEKLYKSGMDFLIISLFMTGYDQKGEVMSNVIKSLENAQKLRIPIWIQATIEKLSQLDFILETLEKYQKTIFNVSIRSVRPFGINTPTEILHISDIISYLGKEDDYTMGNYPFNRYIRLFSKKTKVSFWVNDRRLDPYDSQYVIHNDTILPFHKGMIYDDIFFKDQYSKY